MQPLSANIMLDAPHTGRRSARCSSSLLALRRGAQALLVTATLLPGLSPAMQDSRSSSTDDVPPRPNILFVALDDLNDWTGCLGGHPQARTPNLDRLAASGVLFANAHCPGAACNPSRSALFTGRSPHKSGLYANGQKMRDVLPDAEIIPKILARHGYYSAGSGKMLHYFIDAPSWNDYFPAKEGENPFPRTLYPETRPLSLPVGGPWQYVETDWGPLAASYAHETLKPLSFWVTVFSTAYVISRLTSSRAVRIAGLVAMPLATIAIFSPLIRLVPQYLREIRSVSYGIPLLMHPVFAAVLCGLVALATRATQATPGDEAGGLQRQRRVAP